MGLPVRDQARYWGVATAVFLLGLWFLGNVLLPFIVGGALAYFLDPLADRLERLGLSRVAATTVIAVISLLVVVLLFLAVIPLLFQQLNQLIGAAPQIIGQLQAYLTERFPDILDEGSIVRQTLGRIGATIESKGGAFAQSLLNSALSVINAVVFAVIVPVVAFYMLLDWDKMIAKIDGWLPRDHRDVIRVLARDIDKVLAGFVRGQVSVCLILGTFYSVALILAGLQFGLVVGAIAGAITFIPYVGALIGGALAIGLALFQFWGDWVSIGVIAGIFAAGQFLEGNIITPRLMGNSVGLHPLWLLFALSAFGAVFGFVGMLVAVPVAAALGVLTRFGIAQYMQSRLYQGLSAQAATPPDTDRDGDAG